MADLSVPVTVTATKCTHCPMYIERDDYKKHMEIHRRAAEAEKFELKMAESASLLQQLEEKKRAVSIQKAVLKRQEQVLKKQEEDRKKAAADERSRKTLEEAKARRDRKLKKPQQLNSQPHTASSCSQGLDRDDEIEAALKELDGGSASLIKRSERRAKRFQKVKTEHDENVDKKEEASSSEAAKVSDIETSKCRKIEKIKTGDSEKGSAPDHVEFETPTETDSKLETPTAEKPPIEVALSILNDATEQTHEEEDLASDPVAAVAAWENFAALSSLNAASVSDPDSNPGVVVNWEDLGTEGVSTDFEADVCVFYQRSDNSEQDNRRTGFSPYQTGKKGEFEAYKVFLSRFNNKDVKWVNEKKESGLPYDLTLTSKDKTSVQFIEVKSTNVKNKSWFFLSLREYIFAEENGASFVIARVELCDGELIKITTYRDLMKLLKSKKLKLDLILRTR